MERRRARLAAPVVLGLVAALLLPAGGWGGPRSELVVVSGMWSPPNNFNPINTDSWYGLYPIRFMFLRMLEARIEGGQLKFFPALASRWEAAADNQTFTFTIHPRAAWHDGKPVTADDVLFTLNTISDPRTETNRGTEIATIVGTDARGKRAAGAQLGVRALDARRVEIKTKVPVDPNLFFEQFGTGVPMLPRHVLGDVPPDQLNRHPFMMAPTVGNGPFKFVQYKTDQFIELLANENFHLGAPKYRRLFIRIIPPAVMLAQIERGELDLSAGLGIGEVLIEDWDRVKQMPHVRAVSFAAPAYQYLLYNFQRPYLQDKRVRRAIAHAVNRPLIINQLLRGEAELVEGPIVPMSPYLNKNVKPWPYDPARARALLQEAGWDFSRTLVLRVPTGNVIRERSGDIIRENLVAVGMRVEIQKSDFPTHIAALRSANYDLALVGWGGNLDPDVSSQFRTGAIYNLTHHSIPQLDQLLDEGKATADPARRRQIYFRFQEVFADELPILVLYYPNARTVVAKRMSNVVHNTSGIYDFQPYIWIASVQ
jgi:peptide/nickel transport system substrate-binding protein